MKQILPILGLLVWLVACQNTRVPAWTDGVQAPGNLEPDEARMWEESVAAQNRWQESGYVIEDPELRAYLNEVLFSLMSEDEIDYLTPRVEVIRDPSFNAFAYPNGVIFVHLGLLTRMENEAQLATLLAHEISHSSHRHGLRSLRQFRNQSLFHNTLTIGTSGIGGLFSGYASRSAIAGYSRELETEADEVGWKRLQTAGYDVTEAPKLFEILLEEMEMLDIKEPYYFASHPGLRQRIENFERLQKQSLSAGGRASGGYTNTERFQERIRPHQLNSIQLDLYAGRFKLVPDAIDRAESLGHDPAELAFLRAEWLRRSPEDRDLTAAQQYYRTAIEANDQHSAAHRSLGLMLRRSGDAEQAVIHLRRYLELEPNASDYSIIQTYIDL